MWKTKVAEIILSCAASHSPLLAIAASAWAERAREDVDGDYLVDGSGEKVSYGDLLARNGPRYLAEAIPSAWSAASEACAAALDRLAAEVQAADPDVVVIVGDDQAELFGAEYQPLVAAFTGQTLRTSDKLSRNGVPNWLRAVAPAYGMDRVRSYRGAPTLAVELVEALTDLGVDIGVVGDVPEPTRAGAGHAFGFVLERLLRGGAYPVIPIFLNTFYPPNVPSSVRALELGVALGTALSRIGADARVAVVASGGLSHFVVDESLDRGVLEALAQGDLAALQAIPRCRLTSGTSEILNWIVVAGASQQLTLDWHEYVPVYRTPAGTGCGMGFACWKPARPGEV